MLLLTILGPVGLQRDGVAVALSIKKSLALLLLLARHAAPMPRSRVVALLWPALDEATGRRNLRRELARLREAGVGDAVRADGDTLAASALLACDAQAFVDALARSRHDEALALWRGPAADAFELGDAHAFDDWLAREREQLHEQRRVALRASAAAREASGDVSGALQRIEALLLDDPLQEQHHRDAMRLLGASGRREAALAQYERCRALLRAELGLAPMAETETLAQALRGTPPPGAVGALPTAAPAVPTAPRRDGPDFSPLPPQLPFVGRSAEVEQLERAWASRRPIAIEGEAGIGKSRLAIDFAAAHGPYALARCRPSDAELPYASFTRALRALMGADLPALPAWVGEELARLLPETGASALPIQTDEQRARFFEACAVAWQALAVDNFDAVVLDDWHLADAASRSLLAFISVHRGDDAPRDVRILLALRPELDDAARDALRALLSASGATHLRLQALSADAVLELVRTLSGADAPVRFAGRLLRATEGNPFFVAETLRHLVELGLLTRDAGGGWQTPFDQETEDYRELPLPASVQETVLARVQRLPAASRRVLEAASLADEPFAASLLAPACALSELETVLAIEDAIEAKLLQEHAAGGFAFAHDLVQQSVSASLGAARRRLVHRRLALSGETTGAPPATIAAHHEASGEPRRAIVHRIAAGDHAERFHALPQAVVQWRKALAHQPDAAQAIGLYKRLNWAAKERTDRPALQQIAAELADLLDARSLTPEEHIDAMLQRCSALTGQGANEQALSDLGAAPEHANERQRAQFAMHRGIALHNLGRAAEALTAVDAALALPALPDEDRIDLLDLAFVSEHNAGRFEAALAHAEAQLALALRIGKAHSIARSRYRRGIQLLQMDRLEAAETDLVTAIDECERFGFVRTGRIALYNLTCLHASRGDSARALAAAERALGWQPALEAGALRAMLRVAMVDAQYALGGLGSAWELARLAVADALAQDEPAVRIIVSTCVMPPLALVGEVDLARQLMASIGDDALRQLANPASEMWVGRAQLELLQGDVAAAEAALARLAALGAAVEERVRIRRDQVRAALALARGDAALALTLLPADDTPGITGELLSRGMALRVSALALLGNLSEATVQAARATLQSPSLHAGAALELRRALAHATRATAARAEYTACVAALSATLASHPVQSARFDTLWGDGEGTVRSKDGLALGAAPAA
jgi:DNA-binding SARP family transcriptional activator/tetratricopeptide (TPR) repeat protein